MKEGWTYKKLGEICDYSIGLTYKPTDVCDNGTIVLRSSNIQNEQIDLNDIVRVSCPIKDSLFVNKGDILMCSRNGSARLVGKVAIIPDIKERMTYGTFMMIIRSEYNPFLFYYFKSDVFRKQIKHGEANMINQITRYMLDDVVVSLPPLSDQQRIVSRLDAAFSHIDELKANAEKQLSEAHTLFQKSLAKAMEPKEGWKEKKMKEISNKIGSGATPRGGKKVYINNGTSLVRSMNVYNNEFKYTDLAYINEDAANQLNGVELKKDDVLFNITGASIARCCIVPEDVLPGRVNQHVAIVRPRKDLVLSKFLCLCLLSARHQKELLEIGVAGSTRQAITKADLEDHIVFLPPLSEQQRIVERLDALSAHVRELEENQKKIISECDALKQALLRKVFE